MNKSVQLAIRASEIRSEINGLEPGDATIEKRRELLSQLNTVESEYRGGAHDRGRGRRRRPRRSRPHRRGTRVPRADDEGRASAGVPGRHERRPAGRGREGNCRSIGAFPATTSHGI